MVPDLGVLIIRILLFRVLYWVPLFLETPIPKVLKILKATTNVCQSGGVTPCGMGALIVNNEVGIIRIWNMSY